MDTRCLTRPIHEQVGPGPATCRAGGLNETEPKVVVPVIGGVPVPVRRTEVLRFVVPGTTADHAPAISWPVPLTNPAWEKIIRRIVPKSFRTPMIVLRQARPEKTNRPLREPQDERLVYRRAQHER
jgi:hypothetical protein